MPDSNKKFILDTGCHIVAHAVKSAKVDMVAAYPITPQTSVVEEISAMVERGELDCRFLPVEGEHSAMAACTAASVVGARTFTATSSQGLLYMHEVLHMAAGGRLPVVMVNVNRCIFAPWSIWTDHQDAIAQRDTGWIQLYCSSLQEIYNSVIQAFKIAETTHIPVMVNFDGFILSHCSMAVEIPDQAVIDSFLPEYQPEWVLSPAKSDTYASVTASDEYPRFREQLQNDLEAAKSVIIRTAEEYEATTGMNNGGLLELYRTEDAEVFIFSMGSMASDAKLATDELREQGIKAGCIKLRCFRPFPGEALSAVLPKNSTLIALDRNYSFGNGSGTLYNEARAALYDRGGEIKILNKIMGIGGTDIPYTLITEEVKKLLG